MFVRCITERYPNSIFKIAAHPKYSQHFKNLSNIKSFSYLEYLIDTFTNKIFKKNTYRQWVEESADATVHIGGSIFIEPAKFIPPQNYYSNPKIFFIGCNFGPYKTNEYKEFTFLRLQKAEDVCFRDKYSYDMFSDLDNVRVAPDVLFGYKGYPTPKTGYGIGISVIDLENRSDLKHMADEYYNVIAQIVDDCVFKGIPVKLISFCEDEGDKKAIQEITNRCKTNRAEICEYNGDIDAILDEINECEYVVASRFHAMIIGWCLSKKVFPIIYSDKQTNVIDDVGYFGAKWDLRKEVYTADKLFKDTTSSNNHNIERFIKEADSQFEALDDYLKYEGDFI